MLQREPEADDSVLVPASWKRAAAPSSASDSSTPACSGACAVQCDHRLPLLPTLRPIRRLLGGYPLNPLGCHAPLQQDQLVPDLRAQGQRQGVRPRFDFVCSNDGVAHGKPTSASSFRRWCLLGRALDCGGKRQRHTAFGMLCGWSAAFARPPTIRKRRGAFASRRSPKARAIISRLPGH